MKKHSRYGLLSLAMCVCACGNVLLTRVPVCATQLKDMRSFVFGELSQLIPNADSSRFPCVPLPQSAAQPYVGSDEKGDGFVDIPDTRKKWRYIPGQRLEGHMIHRHVQSINKEMATTSQGDDVNTF